MKRTKHLVYTSQAVNKPGNSQHQHQTIYIIHFVTDPSILILAIITFVSHKSDNSPISWQIKAEKPIKSCLI